MNASANSQIANQTAMTHSYKQLVDGQTLARANHAMNDKRISEILTKPSPIPDVEQRKIILTLDSAHMGGIETHVLTLANYLIEQHYPVEVWFIHRYKDNPLYNELKKHNITFHFAGSTKNYWRMIREQRKHIILHTHGYKAGILARIFAKINRVPVLSTYHSGDLGQGKLRVYSQIDIWTARLGESIAVSSKIQQWLPSSAHLIENFVAIAEQGENSQKPYKNRALQVAFVGRLSHEKGPDLFCRLARLWHNSEARQEDEKPVEFVLYGDGPMRSELIEQYNKQVQFKGHVNMSDYWSSVDVLCISSRYEGLPYVALEAMARGIPVVSFDVGGIAKLIDSQALGWLIEAGNMGKLLQAFEHWYQLDEQQKQTLSNNVQQKIYQQYSTHALVPRIEAIYQRFNQQ